MLRVAVVGAGRMGTAHAASYGRLERARLVGIVDDDASRCTALAATHDVFAAPDLDALFERVRPDVVSIASPPGTHRALAIAAMSRGAHVLVEKPLALGEADARAVVTASKRLHRTLAVGHIERWNAGILRLRHRLEDGVDGAVRHVRAFRWGTATPPRGDEVGVCLDLATHDVDLIRTLARGDVLRVDAFARATSPSSREHQIRGRLEFASGVEGHVDSRWGSTSRVRILVVRTERSRFVVDLLGEAAFEDESGATVDELPWEEAISSMRLRRLELPRAIPGDALSRQLESFLRAVSNEEAPEVTGEDGLAAVTVAAALVASARRAGPVVLGERPPATAACDDAERSAS